MAFIPRRRVLNQELKTRVLANAVGASALTVSVGDACQPGATAHTNFITNAGTTNPILGVVTAVLYKGKVIERTSVVGTNAAQTSGASTVGNDNETYSYWSVQYIPANMSLEYVADADTALAGDYLGNTWLTLVNTRTINTASGAILFSTSGLLTNAAQFFSSGAAPENTAAAPKIIGHFSLFL